LTLVRRCCCHMTGHDLGALGAELIAADERVTRCACC
jgi:hypothetical protein